MNSSKRKNKTIHRRSSVNLDGVNCLELYNELNLQYITQVFSPIQLSIQNDLKQVLFFFSLKFIESLEILFMVYWLKVIAGNAFSFLAS